MIYNMANTSSFLKGEVLTNKCNVAILPTIHFGHALAKKKQLCLSKVELIKKLFRKYHLIVNEKKYTKTNDIETQVILNYLRREGWIEKIFCRCLCCCTSCFFRL